ncbi:MAG: TrmB family transcriptional regulator [Nanoarchaeota archaeon]
MDEIENALTNLNFSDKEIKVYIKLLELGKTGVQRLSELTKINRVTLYSILDNLIKKGAAGNTVIEYAKHFYAIEPEKILSQLEEKNEKFRKILPLLKEKQNTIGLKPEIEFYEGEKGIISVESEVLKSKKDFFAYGSFEIYNRILEYSGLSFRKKRILNKITVQCITDDSAKNHEMFNKPEYKRYTKVRILNSLKDMPSWTYLFDNKVVILSFEKENPIAILINSEAVYLKEKIIFDLMLK